MAGNKLHSPAAYAATNSDILMLKLSEIQIWLQITKVKVVPGQILPLECKLLGFHIF